MGPCTASPVAEIFTPVPSKVPPAGGVLLIRVKMSASENNSTLNFVLLYPQSKIMTAENNSVAKLLAQLINNIRQALLAVVLSSRGVQGKPTPETTFINVRELK